MSTPPSRSFNEHDKLPHPPVRARRYDTAVQGPLTDEAIMKYALAGHYGDEMQRRAQALVKQKKKTPKQQDKMQSLVNDILNELL